MVIKDRFSSWFMRRIIKNKVEEMEPGFVVTNVGENLSLREVFLPEEFLVKVENELDSQELYEIGKNFGWRYASISSFPQIEEDGKTEVAEFLEFFMAYIEYIYASSIEYEMDLESKVLEILAQDYVVCRKNGEGHILSQGAVAGCIGYMMQDKSIEAVKSSCQGRGDEKCKVIAKPSSQIDHEVYSSKLYASKDLSAKYEIINKVTFKDIKADDSIKDFIDKAVFEYHKGSLNFRDNRLILVESSLIYLLENKVEDEALYDISFDCGRNLAQGEDSIEFVKDFVSALGWGDLRTLEDESALVFHKFPWTSLASDSDFPIVRGLMSGFMSSIRNKDTRFREYEVQESKRGFDLFLYSV